MNLSRVVTFRTGLVLAMFFVLWAGGTSAAEQGRESLTELTLEKAYVLALRNNELIKISRRNLEQAGENVTISKSALMPTLSVEGTARRKKQSAASFDNNQENLTGTARFSQPIYQGGQLWFGLEAARLASRAEQLRHFRRKQEVLLNVAQRFYKSLLARREVDLSENSLKRSEKQLDRAQARFRVDEISRTPVLRAEVQVSEAEEQLERGTNQYDVSLEKLALELGIDTTPRQIEGDVDVETRLRSMENYMRRAYDERRDLQQFQMAQKKAREQVKIQKSDWFPDLSVEASGDRYDKPIADEREDWNVQAVMSYQIFSGWRDSSEIDKAKSQYQQARERVQRIRREIRLQVREAYLNIETQRNVIETLENQVDSARENYRQVSAQFEEGLVNSVDVSDAITVLNESELRLANARTQYRLDLLTLKLATGVFQQSRIEM